jgi:hypothetical protein
MGIVLFAPFVVSGLCWFERNNSFVADVLRTHYACESLCIFFGDGKSC